MKPALSDSQSQTWEHLAKIAHYDNRTLASLLGVSVRTLQRHFATHYGMTLGEFLSVQRIHEALRLLNAGESVKAACYTVGFRQVSHFSRVFKQFFGAPPSCWKIGPLDHVRLAGGPAHLPLNRPVEPDCCSALVA
jgi:AraC-like DNA-binding protein